MHSERASLPLRIAAIGGLLFLHLPILLIFVYAFTTEQRGYTFPPPGLTIEWFAVAWNREDIWPPFWLSLQVASIATAIAIIANTVTCAVKALVEATPISGPAWVYAPAWLARGIDAPTTLQIPMMVAPLDFANSMAAKVSAVSPDCEMAKTKSPSLIIGLR